MVNATIDNQSFKLKSIHPANEETAASLTVESKIFRRVRGCRTCSRRGVIFTTGDNRSRHHNRLKAIRLDMYRWESGRYSDYDKFIDIVAQGL